MSITNLSLKQDNESETIIMPIVVVYRRVCSRTAAETHKHRVEESQDSTEVEPSWGADSNSTEMLQIQSQLTVLTVWGGGHCKMWNSNKWKQKNGIWTWPYETYSNNTVAWHINPDIVPWALCSFWMLLVNSRVLLHDTTELKCNN